MKYEFKTRKRVDMRLKQLLMNFLCYAGVKFIACECKLLQETSFDTHRSYAAYALTVVDVTYYLRYRIFNTK